MSTENNGSQPMAKKSLVNAINNLQMRLDRLRDVKEESNIMIRKFKREESPLGKVDKMEKEPKPPTLDIVDQLNELADSFKNQIELISQRINEMTDYIQ